MRFVPTPIPGVHVVELERHEDERGFFARAWSGEELAAAGLNGALAQCSLSRNVAVGTLRGMHFQREPHAEAKLVRCIRGAIYDVIVDLRKTSPSYCRWAAFELTGENRLALYVPPGIAHGFQTLADDTELYYQMSEHYAAPSSDGVRWDDPAFGIRWPIPDPLLSEKDRSYPDFAA